MELRVEDGKYLERRYGGLETVTGIEEAAQRIMMKLSCRRSEFFPNPNFGSRLHLLHSIKPSERRSAAELFVSEALQGEEDFELVEFEIADCSEGEIRLSMIFAYKGERMLIKTII